MIVYCVMWHRGGMVVLIHHLRKKRLLHLLLLIFCHWGPFSTAPDASPFMLADKFHTHTGGICSFCSLAPGKPANERLYFGSFLVGPLFFSFWLGIINDTIIQHIFSAVLLLPQQSERYLPSNDRHMGPVS